MSIFRTKPPDDVVAEGRRSLPRRPPGAPDLTRRDVGAVIDPDGVASVSTASDQARSEYHDLPCGIPGSLPLSRFLYLVRFAVTASGTLTAPGRYLCLAVNPAREAGVGRLAWEVPVGGRGREPVR